MIATIVTNDDELHEIVALSQKNIRSNLAPEKQNAEGFVTWHYSFELLAQMNNQHPHVIVKDKDKVIAYALVALKEAGSFHENIKAMMLQLDTLKYNDSKLKDHAYYVMGQVCIDEDYRGKGVFEMLYNQHKKLFEYQFDFVLTEISTSNKRSLRAHDKIGFTTIHTYSDDMDEWNVVVWDWK